MLNELDDEPIPRRRHRRPRKRARVRWRMTRVYIAIGSNLASPLEQVNAAVTALAAIPDSRMVAVSSLFHAAALGPQDQPDYRNAVALERNRCRLKPCWIIPSASNCSRVANAKPNAGAPARWISISCCLVMR
jgi:hypothetical protein